ncbi:hypothetical protein [Streptomyces albireticuli]|uniref:hypothetical protein n=1 Tax=Streptomyces albireticuli TaxID=1940 RepID=UPI0014744CCA|nr:hypothetical protein [Streptomyces albireticuli]MCD9142175.1 hypothetical protein [Streptomyces albireticuli]MCD9162571.1 hypothetical protein [Streptomyces albireticuli]MCD9190349.1 hypothetical protein [Streptomyces albireticuli]
MAKNKNQKTPQKQSVAERGAQQAKSSSLESQAEQRAQQVTPGDMARKGRQKRFGHN